MQHNKIVVMGITIRLQNTLMYSLSRGVIWFQKVYEYHLGFSSVIPVIVYIDLFEDEINVQA